MSEFDTMQASSPVCPQRRVFVETKVFGRMGEEIQKELQESLENLDKIFKKENCQVVTLSIAKRSGMHGKNPVIYLGESLCEIISGHAEFVYFVPKWAESINSVELRKLCQVYGIPCIG